MAVESYPITDRETWLAWRMKDVTASDIGAVCGVDPYKTPAKVWAEKTGLISPQPQTEFLEFRLCLEAAVVDMCRRRRPHWDIRRAEVYRRDPDLRMGCTPDAVAIDPERPGLGVIQCKTVLATVYEREWRDLDGDLAEAPLNYQLQTATEAMLCGANWAAVAALVLEGPGTGHFKLAPVERNPAVEARIRDTVARFWAITDAGNMPTLNYEQDIDVITALYPEARVKNPPLDLSQDNRLPALLAKYKRRKAYVKAADKECEKIKAEVMDKMGHHETAQLPGWRISWKMQTRPERITPEWKGRVLRITNSRGETND